MMKAYDYDFFDKDPIDHRLRPPAHLIKKANQDAKVSFRSHQSWQVMRNKIERILNHNDYKEIDRGSERLAFLSKVGAVLFVTGLFVEWQFSKGIYLSETSFGFLLFTGIVLTGIYCSACFAQLTPEYRFKSSRHHAGKGELHPDLYPESDEKHSIQWRFLHPLNGLAVFLIVQALILYLSFKRVAYHQTMDVQAANDLLFPCLLFVIEIIFGIPFYFTLERLYIKSKKRKYQRQLTKGEIEITRLVESALDCWYRYEAAMQDYNIYMRQNDQPEAVPIPANKYLQRLIENENGMNNVHQIQEPNLESGKENLDD